MLNFPYVWRVRTRLPERFGHRCRVIVRGAMNSASVEFEDSFRVVTSRNYLRLACPRPSQGEAKTSEDAPTSSGERATHEPDFLLPGGGSEEPGTTSPPAGTRDGEP